MFWNRNAERSRPVPVRRMADLLAMSPVARAAALAGPERDSWIKAAASYGFVEAQTLLGQLLLDRGLPEEAFGWFRAAADAGHAPALNMLGRCHECGWGVPADPAAAAPCYRRAAELGSAWAHYNLATLHLYGLGIERDRERAFGLFGAAARQGHAKAMNMLGRFYDEGWGRPRDAGRAAAWFYRAAEGGDFRGQFNLATILAYAGQRHEALRWLERALAQGSADFVADAGAALRRHGDPAFRSLGERVGSPATPASGHPAPRDDGRAPSRA